MSDNPSKIIPQEQYNWNYFKNDHENNWNAFKCTIPTQSI